MYSPPTSVPDADRALAALAAVARALAARTVADALPEALEVLRSSLGAAECAVWAVTAHGLTRLDGAGEWRIFTRIVLPMSKPLVAVLFFMSLLSSWNDFAWPLIALKDNELFTLPIGLLYLQGQYGPDYTATMAFALVNVAPMVVVFLVFQRFFVQGFARSGLR